MYDIESRPYGFSNKKIMKVKKRRQNCLSHQGSYSFEKLLGQLQRDG